jgi:uncharacterized UPF0160 family protein
MVLSIEGRVVISAQRLSERTVYKTFVQASGMIYKYFGTIMLGNIYWKKHEDMSKQC